MKKIILICLFGLFLLRAFNSISQCSFSGLSPTVCLNASPVTLTPSGPGQLFSGPGVNGNIFTPSLAGIGIKTISATCPASYTHSSGAFGGINTGGITLAMGDDDVQGPFSIGFSFRFFCFNYSTFYISSNGFITFSANQADGCCSGDFLPNNSSPDNLIAFAWADLDPTAGGAVTYTTIGVAPNRTLLVTFAGIEHYSDPNTVTSQVQLHETTNLIEIHTVAMLTDGNDHTMGIENNNGTVAFVVPGRNQDPSWSAFNEMQRFTPGPCIYSQTTSVVSPSINVTGTSTVCQGGSTTLTASGAATYTWSSNAGSSQSSSVAVTPATNTTYTVNGTDANGCAGSAIQTVSVTTSQPISIAGPDFTFCAGQSVTLQASGADSYTWGSGATGSVLVVTPLVQTVYSLTGQTGNCISYTVDTVYVEPVPSLSVTMSGTFICMGKSLTLTGMGASNYTWTSGPGLNTATAVVVVSPPAGNYNYTLTGAGTNGCISATTRSFVVSACTGIETINRSELPFSVFPNPNTGDFYVEAAQPSHLKLYNDAGQLIREINTPRSGKPVHISNVPPGVYFLTSGNGENEVRQKIVITR